MFKEPDVVHYIKIRHLNWMGHVIHINNSNVLKEMFSERPIKTRRGRPSL